MNLSAGGRHLMKHLLTLLFLMLGNATAATPAPRPNVLIILADDLGFSDLGCYGGEIATPVLDSLARDGLRFTQFYNTARCWPSRAVVLTGYYAQQVRRDANPRAPGSIGQGTRPAWAPLLSERLRALGYRSYHSGKWHLDGQPLANGFDRAYTLDDHDRHFGPKRHVRDGQPLPAVTAGDPYYTSTAIADHALENLRDHAAHHAGRPFFQHLTFTAPHFPLHAPAEDLARYRDRYLGGWDALRAERAGRLKALGIAAHDLPAIERGLGPPYRFTNHLETLGVGEVFLPLAWEELTPEQ